MITRLPAVHDASAGFVRRLGSTSGWRAVLAVGALAFGAAAGAQEAPGGTLLVSSSELGDPSFSRSVVLLLRHDDNGAIGVVINRVTSLSPGKVFPELADNLGKYSGTLYRGGPLAPGRVLFLVRGLAAATVQGPEIVDKVFLSADADALAEITRLASGPDELRIYAGHAEWTAGQLESELKHGAWSVVPATADLVFGDKPQKLWEQLAARAADTTADSRAPTDTGALSAAR